MLRFRVACSYVTFRVEGTKFKKKYNVIFFGMMFGFGVIIKLKPDREFHNILNKLKVVKTHLKTCFSA